MIDWLGLDRTKTLRDVILAYQEEIELERSRVATLRERLETVQMAHGELERRGADPPVHHGVSLVERQLKHRIEATEHQIELMDHILVHFREELARQGAAGAQK